MKKSLLIVLSMLFVLGLAVSAFALDATIPSETQAAVAKGATQLTIGGEIRFRGEWRNNLDFNDDLGDNNSASDGRVRLHISAQVTPNTEGFIQLESGNADNTDLYTWGASGAATGNLGAGIGNAKRGDIRILQAWIQHKGSGLLGIPAGIKVGHMPIKLGRGLFLDHSKFGDDVILVFADPTKDLHIAFADVKYLEGASNIINDDTNARALLVDFKGKGFNLGSDITYTDVQDFVGAVPSGGGATTTEGLHLWNLGLRGDTTISAVTLYADLELQAGTAKGDYLATAAGTRGDRQFRGYAWLLGASVDLTGVTVGLEAAYGSGDKCDYSIPNVNDSSAAGHNNCNSGGTNESFVTSLGADQHYTYVYEYRAQSAADNNDAFGVGTGLANTWYLKASASAKPMKDLTTSAAIYYLNASEPVAIRGALDSNGRPKTEKNLGVEIDGKVVYQIDKNLIYFVEGGYLIADDAYNRDDPRSSANNNNLDASDAYAIRHGISLTF